MANPEIIVQKDPHCSFSVCYLNIQCLRNKVHLLDAYLSDSDYDLVCLLEHWLADDEIGCLDFTDYHIVSYFCRSVRSHGGVAIFARKSLKCDNMAWAAKLSVEFACELSGVYLPERNVYVLAVYRTGVSDVAVLETVLVQVLNKILKNPSASIILGGDFNIRFDKNDVVSLRFLTFLQSFGLIRTIHDYTRGLSCIDNIFTNCKDYKARVINPYLSDHSSVCISVNIESAGVYNNSLAVFRPVTLRGLFTLYGLVQGIDWSYVDSHAISINCRFDIFIADIEDCIEKSFPLRSRRADSRKVEVKWFSERLRSIRETWRFLQAATARPELVEHAKVYQSFYKREIMLAKKRAFSKYIENSSNAVSGAWRVVNCHRKTRQVGPHASLTPDLMNRHFSHCAETLLDRLPSPVNDSLHYLQLSGGSGLVDAFRFLGVTPIQVRDAIYSLKKSDSKDIFGINGRIVKCIGDLIYLPLTKLFNCCIEAGVFPEVLKTALVIPVHKRGPNDNPDNFRPISLLPIIGKIFEKLLKGQIEAYVSGANLLHCKQYGFRKGRSTTDAVDSLLCGVRECFESDRYFGSLFCDLTKAFDCVPHNLLLTKLKYYGFDRVSIQLLASYLSNREQLVSIGGKNSGLQCVKYGVPQGSILGPLLFLLHINDLPYCVNAQFTLFADDTTVSVSDSSLTNLEYRLGEVRSAVEDWFLANRLGLNAAKSQTMLFTLKHIPVDSIPAADVKFLGMVLDSKLTWGSHCEYVMGKLAKCTFLLRNLRPIISDSVMLRVYYALFDSLLRYGILAWGHSAAAKELFALQRRAVRIVAGIEYRSCCRGSFRNFKILTLPCLFILECLKWTHTNAETFHTSFDVHGRETRFGKHIRVPYHRVYAGRCGKSYFGPLLYNLLPDSVKSYGSVLFGVRLKRFLAAKAYYSVVECLDDRFSDILDL